MQLQAGTGSIELAPCEQAQGIGQLGFHILGAAPGLAQYLLHPPATGGMDILLLTLFVVVAGTLVPFGLYLQGRDRLSAIEAGVAGTMEPVSAAVVAFVVLGVVLQPLQYLGGALMLVAVVLIAGARPPKPPDVSRPPKG